MLSFLNGSLVAKAAESPRGAYFLVDVHGVGFEVFSSQRSVEQSPPVGESVILFTSLIVREDALFLVGFSSKEERDLFNILQSASGVGVKVALALLSALPITDIVQAVVSNQHALLTKAKGVGPKLAQKITLELKEKMMAWRPTASGSLPAEYATQTQSPATAAAFQEAQAVLLSLGYQPDEIARSFQALPADQTEPTASEVILREALRWLAQSV